VPLNERALDESIRRLDRSAPDDVGVETTVGALLDVVAVLCRCSGAGLLLLDGAGVLRQVAASSESVAALLATEEATGRGPAHDAVASDAVARAGGVVAAPVRVGPEPVGALVVPATGEEEGDLPEAVRCYARLVEVVLAPALQARRREEVVAQLQHALDSRVVVERAVGYLMASGGDDARNAFERLRRAARSSRRQVADLAARLLAGEPIDAEVSPPPAAGQERGTALTPRPPGTPAPGGEEPHRLVGPVAPGRTDRTT
jgi:hypothetical protein